MSRDHPEGSSGLKRDRWQWLRDAFSMESDREALSEHQLALLEKIARYVVKRHLTVPAIMVLESVRPMNYLGSQAMVFFEPMVKALFTAKEYTEIRIILERRHSIETLLTLIEQQESRRLQVKDNPHEATQSATTDRTLIEQQESKRLQVKDSSHEETQSATTDRSRDLEAQAAPSAETAETNEVLSE